MSIFRTKIYVSQILESLFLVIQHSYTIPMYTECDFKIVLSIYLRFYKSQSSSFFPFDGNKETELKLKMWSVILSVRANLDFSYFFLRYTVISWSWLVFLLLFDQSSFMISWLVYFSFSKAQKSFIWVKLLWLLYN